MWIHVHHGDEGLRRILLRLSSFTGREEHGEGRNGASERLWRARHLVPLLLAHTLSCLFDLRVDPRGAAAQPVLQDGAKVRAEPLHVFMLAAVSAAHFSACDAGRVPCRRMKKAGVELPPYLDELELRGDDLDPALHTILTEVCFIGTALVPLRWIPDALTTASFCFYSLHRPALRIARLLAIRTGTGHCASTRAFLFKSNDTPMEHPIPASVYSARLKAHVERTIMTPYTL